MARLGRSIPKRPLITRVVQSALSEIVGVLSITEADDTLSSASAVAIAAGLAATQEGDTLSSTAVSGTVGTAEITEAGDTVASAALIAISAAVAITEANDTLTSTSTLTLVGSATVTEEGDLLSAASAVAIVAISSITESGDTISSAATIGAANPIWTISFTGTEERAAILTCTTRDAALTIVSRSTA